MNAFPPLSEDYPTQCGWNYGPSPAIPPIPANPTYGWPEVPGRPAEPATITLIRFDPFGPTPQGDEPARCDMCDATSDDTPLWWWSDQWSGGVSVGGMECAACLRTSDDPTMGWCPSPLQITAG